MDVNASSLAIFKCAVAAWKACVVKSTNASTDQAVPDFRSPLDVSRDGLEILARFDHQFIRDVRVQVRQARFHRLGRNDAGDCVPAHGLHGVSVLDDARTGDQREKQRPQTEAAESAMQALRRCPPPEILDCSSIHVRPLSKDKEAGDRSGQHEQRDCSLRSEGSPASSATQLRMTAPLFRDGNGRTTSLPACRIVIEL